MANMFRFQKKENRITDTDNQLDATDQSNEECNSTDSGMFLHHL